jgi:hypothetical protein
LKQQFKKKEKNMRRVCPMVGDFAFPDPRSGVEVIACVEGEMDGSVVNVSVGSGNGNVGRISVSGIP